MDGMPQRRPPHLVMEFTRHKRRVWYVRKGHAARIRIRAEYGTPEFWAEYAAALDGAPVKPGHDRPAPHTFSWAVDRYRNSLEWNDYSRASRKQSDAIFKSLQKTIGREPLARITKSTIENAMNARRSRPHAANNFLKAMRRLFAWAAATTPPLVKENPTVGVKLLRGTRTDGFHTWTEEEVERFEAHWPRGTRARLAFDLLLYTGLRRGDVVKLGRQHVRDGIITLRTAKTGQVVFIPILPELAASIEATKTGDLTYLVTRDGTPFVKEGFGNWFKRVCREAGCPGAAHGVRKAGATRVADGGASSRTLNAIFGWTGEKMAHHYTEAANRKRLSIEHADLLAGRSRNDVNPAPVPEKSRTFRKAAE